MSWFIKLKNKRLKECETLGQGLEKNGSLFYFGNFVASITNKIDERWRFKTFIHSTQVDILNQYNLW